MTRERPSIRASEPSILALWKKEIDFINEKIVSIVPCDLRVMTERQVLHPDFLVVALGADFSLSAVPGFGDGAYNLYSSEGAEALQSALRNFRGGRIAGLISRFDGKENCWIEIDGGLAALGEGDIYASPNPQVTVKPPSSDYRHAKQEYEQRILRKW
ncbi:MAG: hypothetical protein V2G42_00960 [bacterium JZ-2024 1]